jgi:transcriptional regulator with XRE-family HTH domain
MSFDLKRRRLAIAREAKGMNRSQLARAAKMQAGTIAWIETGRFVPYESQLDKIADALGWEGDPSELFEEVRDADDLR